MQFLAGSSDYWCTMPINWQFIRPRAWRQVSCDKLKPSSSPSPPPPSSPAQGGPQGFYSHSNDHDCTDTEPCISVFDQHAFLKNLIKYCSAITVQPLQGSAHVQALPSSIPTPLWFCLWWFQTPRSSPAWKVDWTRWPRLPPTPLTLAFSTSEQTWRNQKVFFLQGVSEKTLFKDFHTPGSHWCQWWQ